MRALESRVAQRTAIQWFAVFILSLGGIAIAGEPAPANSSQKVRDLQKERLATAREVLKMATATFKNQTGSIDQLQAATRLAYDAELDMCDTDKDRVAVLTKFVAAAKENEQIAQGFAKAGQTRVSDSLLAKAERLRVEIELERAKDKIAAKAK
jgi:hypothetical protein